MLQDYTGDPAERVGDTFVIHMDRESLNDFAALTKYDVTAYYDWSLVNDDIKDRFPVVPELALRATLGILERTARRGL
jgi:hypothetical protein